MDASTVWNLPTQSYSVSEPKSARLQAKDVGEACFRVNIFDLHRFCKMQRRNLLNKRAPTGLDFNRLDGVSIIDRVNLEIGFWLKTELPIVRAITDILSLNNGSRKRTPDVPVLANQDKDHSRWSRVVPPHPTRALYIVKLLTR
ncbi:hypothetical protein PENCOP_c002G07371 [Penicillium coprophilum]|uniref:Uncharacterized protein n=1 Tax=Penicillium coprophilum TaxID=36646 RepID=A0A1V6V2U5_9EURO|nr:hypothetical protein PENCOP_c002G07371 [Penicillium coprophilum]